MHYHYVEDETGDLVDLVPLCSDACHKDYAGEAYSGWSGCHEGGDSAEFCANCGVFAGGMAECNCQRDKLVVNRFPSVLGEKCEHGNWIQLPNGRIGERS